MGSQKCGIVGKSQPVLIMINPIIFSHTRTTPAAAQAKCVCQEHGHDSAGDWRPQCTPTNRTCTADPGRELKSPASNNASGGCAEHHHTAVSPTHGAPSGGGGGKGGMVDGHWYLALDLALDRAYERPRLEQLHILARAVRIQVGVRHQHRAARPCLVGGGGRCIVRVRRAPLKLDELPDRCAVISSVERGGRCAVLS
eukprot:COSAG01_NODE_4989_length_4568_cov_6.110141_4_plen_198_part_00